MNWDKALRLQGAGVLRAGLSNGYTNPISPAGEVKISVPSGNC